MTRQNSSQHPCQVYLITCSNANMIHAPCEDDLKNFWWILLIDEPSQIEFLIRVIWVLSMYLYNMLTLVFHILLLIRSSLFVLSLLEEVISASVNDFFCPLCTILSYVFFLCFIYLFLPKQIRWVGLYPQPLVLGSLMGGQTAISTMTKATRVSQF